MLAANTTKTLYHVLVPNFLVLTHLISYVGSRENVVHHNLIYVVIYDPTLSLDNEVFTFYEIK
jgi:hypothetical protein